MKNTPELPIKRIPRANSESFPFNKDSEGKLLPGSQSKLFDSNGNLILRKGAIETFQTEMRRKTGIMVRCPKCGHQWERMTRKAGKVRCHSCGKRIELEALE
jgi:ribosomal protein S27E